MGLEVFTKVEVLSLGTFPFLTPPLLGVNVGVLVEYVVPVDDRGGWKEDMWTGRRHWLV